MDEFTLADIKKVLIEDFGDFLGAFQVGCETTEYGLYEAVGVKTSDNRIYHTKPQNTHITEKPDYVYEIWKVVADAWLSDPTTNRGARHSHPKPKLPSFKVYTDTRTPYDTPPPARTDIKSRVNVTIPEREADVRWQMAFKRQWEKMHGF